MMHSCVQNNETKHVASLVLPITILLFRPIPVVSNEINKYFLTIQSDYCVKKTM